MSEIKQTANKTPPTASSLSLCKAHGITDYVYIGRRVTQGSRIINGSIWGNPFTVSTNRTPKECLEAYEAHIRSSTYLMSQIPTLASKTLACWCKSRQKPDAPCHGDVLVKLFQEYADNQPTPRITSGYQCARCDSFFTSYDSAVDCCGPVKAWRCADCNEMFDDFDAAGDHECGDDSWSAFADPDGI